MTIDRRALKATTIIWLILLRVVWSVNTIRTQGFDFDEVLMICTGLAAIAWVVTDYKRDRDLQSTMMTLHEDLGRIKTMVGWDLPHSLSERVAKLEAVAPEAIGERIAAVDSRVSEAIRLESRVAVLEDTDALEQVTERIDNLDERLKSIEKRRKRTKTTE